MTAGLALLGLVGGLDGGSGHDGSPCHSGGRRLHAPPDGCPAAKGALSASDQFPRRAAGLLASATGVGRECRVLGVGAIGVAVDRCGWAGDEADLRSAEALGLREARHADKRGGGEGDGGDRTGHGRYPSGGVVTPVRDDKKVAAGNHSY